MPVFNQSVATTTSMKDLQKDSATPSLGSLSLGSMPSFGALAGTTGTDVSLVHGDVWNQITANQTENVLGNLKLTVSKDEKHTVLRNLVSKVVGSTNETWVGVHNLTNIAPVNAVLMHTRSETHHQPEHREQKTEDHSFMKSLLEFKEKHFEWTGFKTEVKDITLEFSAPLAFEKKFFSVGNSIFAMEGEAIDVKWSEIKNSMGALATEVKGGKLKAAATHVKAIAGNINAGLALNADSPFA